MFGIPKKELHSLLKLECAVMAMWMDRGRATSVGRRVEGELAKARGWVTAHLDEVVHMFKGCDCVSHKMEPIKKRACDGDEEGSRSDHS
jgi:hypothetical protein